MTGYPPMTQPSTSFEVETDGAAREDAAFWRAASAACAITQRCARASRAISVRAHACSVARADTGRTQRPSASATAEQPRRRHTSAEGSQTTPSRRTNLKIRSFRTSLGHEGLLFGLRCHSFSLAFDRMARGVRRTQSFHSLHSCQNHWRLT